MYGSQLDENRLVSINVFKSKVIPSGRRADDEDVHSIVAVVSRAANLREVKTATRAKPFYYVDFEVVDDSSPEALSVKLWGEVERFDQLKHELVEGVTIVLQSVVLHSDYYRMNRLTIQEYRYGYSSCIYIVKEKNSVKNVVGDYKYYLDRGNDNIPTVPLFDGRFVTLEQRIQILAKWKRSSTFLASTHHADPSFVGGLTEAATLAPTTNSVVDICLTIEAIKSVASRACYLRDLHVRDLEGQRARLELHEASRDKLEAMLCDCLSARIMSPLDGDTLTPAGYEEKVTITMLTLHAKVVRSRQGTVDTLRADDDTSFFGFNDARGLLPLAEAEETSFDQLYRHVTAPLTSLTTSHKPQLFRIRCRLHAVAFPDFCIHLNEEGSHDRVRGRGCGGDAPHDNQSREPVSLAHAEPEPVPPPSAMIASEPEREPKPERSEEGEGDGGTCVVLLSRLLETRRHPAAAAGQASSVEVKYRDVVFSIGSAQEQSAEDRCRKKRPREGYSYSQEGSGDGKEQEQEQEGCGFVYSASFPSSNPPLPPSARSPAPDALSSSSSVARGTLRVQGRGGLGPGQGQGQGQGPGPGGRSSCRLSQRDSQLSQLHSYFSQAQAPPALSDSQDKTGPRIALMVKDAALTRLFCNIPAALAAVCLAKEKAPPEDKSDVFPEPTHNYAESVRMLAASIAQSVARADNGVSIECVAEVLPRNDEKDLMLGNQHLLLLHSCSFV